MAPQLGSFTPPSLPTPTGHSDEGPPPTPTPPPPPPPPPTTTSDAKSATSETPKVTTSVPTTTTSSRPRTTETSRTGTDQTSSATAVLPQTTPSSTDSITAAASSSILPSSSSTIFESSSATNAAITSSTATPLAQEASCSGIACSPGLKAAVAVPVVVLGLLLLLGFCIFARRRRKEGGESAGQKWTRHLRVFSFDAELLVGGRYSGSNSVGSREPSVMSAQPSLRTQNSLQSVEQAAPPYRDALSHARPPTATMSQVLGYSAFGTILPSDIVRPDSSATAPPPYRAAVAGSNRDDRSPTTPTSASNPFQDSEPVSPVDGSPFADPPDDANRSPAERRMFSRSSSQYHSVRGDDASVTSTVAEQDDNASIREAQVARNMSGRGRTIDNFRKRDGN